MRVLNFSPLFFSLYLSKFIDLVKCNRKDTFKLNFSSRANLALQLELPSLIWHAFMHAESDDEKTKWHIVKESRN